MNAHSDQGLLVLVFFRTFGFASTQEEVYAEVSPLVNSALDG